MGSGGGRAAASNAGGSTRAVGGAPTFTLGGYAIRDSTNPYPSLSLPLPLPLNLLLLLMYEAGQALASEAA